MIIFRTSLYSVVRRTLFVLLLFCWMNGTAYAFSEKGLPEQFSEKDHELMRDCIEKDGYLFVPDHLYHLNNVDLLHIKSALQEGKCCSWFAIFNAVALQKCLEKGGVGPEQISAIVRGELYSNVVESKDVFEHKLGVKALQGLPMSKLGQLASELECKDYLILELVPRKRWCRIFLPTVRNEMSPYIEQSRFTEYTNFYYLKSPKLFFKKLFNTPDEKVTHFFISVPSTYNETHHHCVLLTLIKRDNKKPLLLYMDSNNSLLHEDYFCEDIRPLAMTKLLQAIDKAAKVEQQ